MYTNYLETEIQSADPVQLVRMLYRGALDATIAARGYLQAGDIGSRSRSITKAHAILTELARCLNHDVGGEISRNLVELYDYMQRRLLAANMEQNDAPLAEVDKVLRELLEAWSVCQSEPRAAQPVPEQTQPPYHAQEFEPFAAGRQPQSFTY
jgi:flagellar protein FliS